MSVDPYSACPGGTGKKVKFCCQDLLNELGKIQQMTQGNQTAACLEYTTQLCEKYPDRPCLMSSKTLMAYASRQTEAAGETIKTFIEKFPANPVAQALQGLDSILNGNVTEALDSLQAALAGCETEMPNNVYQPMKLIARSLLNLGHILPARGVMSQLLTISQGQDESIKQLFMEFETAAQIPTIFKDVVLYEKCKPGVSYQEKFDAALDLAIRGVWRKAAERWESLLTVTKEDPAIWKNLAIVYGYNGDYDKAADAWRSFAELDVPQDEEIEAEAMAQLLRRESSEGNVDDLSVVIAVKDYEQAEQKFINDKRAEKITVDMKQYGDQGKPPPRAVFAILDRPQPDSSAGLSSKDIPRIIGNLFLFGKETDREARIEVDVFRTNLDALLKTLQEIAGGALGEKLSESVEGSVSRLELALSWQWKFPVNTGWHERMRLLREQREQVILEIWPTLNLPLLDNMTPLEVAADWNKRDRLQAAIMLIEMSDPSEEAPSLFAKLRDKLGLPSMEQYDPANFDVQSARLSRFLYLNVEKASLEMLVQSFERVMMAQFMPAARRIATEMIRRGEAVSTDYRLAAYYALVRVTDDSDISLQYIDTATKLADRLKHSTAFWDLEQLKLRLQRQEGNEVARLIQHIYQAHLREEGVAEKMFQIMAQAGLIGPNGEMMVPTAPRDNGSIIVGADTTTGSESKLWTPDGGTEPGEKKSSLWVPE